MRNLALVVLGVLVAMMMGGEGTFFKDKHEVTFYFSMFKDGKCSRCKDVEINNFIFSLIQPKKLSHLVLRRRSLAPEPDCWAVSSITQPKM